MHDLASTQIAKFVITITIGFGTAFCCSTLCGQETVREIPDPLKPWREWATWQDKNRDCPPVYNRANDRICFWPSRLSIEAQKSQCNWRINVTAFADTWMPLPGSTEIWPQKVRSNEGPLIVVERDGKPAVRLAKGQHQIDGEFQWEELPQRLTIPQSIGLLTLQVDGELIEVPSWDAQGDVWLTRIRADQAEKETLTAQVYRVIEDGIPLWLRTDIELSVTGKNREEDIGWLLPAGWTLATVDSPLPIAVDDQGRARRRSGPESGRFACTHSAPMILKTSIFPRMQSQQPMLS